MSHMPPNEILVPPPLDPRTPFSFPFSWKATMAANAVAAAVVSPAPGTYVPTTIATLHDGGLVGIRAICEAITAGTATIVINVNGNPTALSLSLTSSTPNGATGTGTVEYVAGDLIGVSITTSPDFLPASGWDVLVEVQCLEPIVASVGLVNHGIVDVTARQNTTALSPNAAGTGWNFIADTAAGGTAPQEWTVLKNFTTSPVQTTYYTPTHHYPNTNYSYGSLNQLLASNGRIFFLSEDLYISYYDPITEQIAQIGPLVESPPIVPTVSTIPYTGTFAVDGRLWILTQESQYRPSCLSVLDPVTLSWVVVSYIGSGALSYSTFGTQVAPDTGTATKTTYGVYGENPWQLWSTDVTPGPTYGQSAMMTFPDGSLAQVSSTGNISIQMIAGQGYYATFHTDLGHVDDVVTTYWLIDRTLVAKTNNTSPSPRNVTPAGGSLVSPPQLDLSGGAGSFRWRPNGSSGSYANVDYTLNYSAPVTIESLCATANGIAGNGQNYLGVFKLDAPTWTLTQYGAWPSGISESVWLNVGSDNYIIGYPNGVAYKFTPTSAWDLGNNPPTTSVNPKFLGNFGLNGTQAAGIKYARHAGWSAATGRLYCSGDRDRNGTGMGVGYCIVAGPTFAGVYSSSQGSTGPTQMAGVLSAGLVVDDTHGLIAVSSRNISGTGTALLFVFNQALSSSSIYSPLAGVANLGRIFATSTPGIVCGVIQGAGNSLALYRVNITTGALLSYVETSFTGALGAMTQHTNGSVWVMVDRTLVRVDVNALTVAKVAGLNSAMPIGVISFAHDGTNLFISGGSPSGVNGAQLYSLAVTP